MVLVCILIKDSNIVLKQSFGVVTRMIEISRHVISLFQRFCAVIYRKREGL